MVYDGEVLPLTKVSRNEMGAYLCIATNGVPPSVSKRIILDVECNYKWCIFGLFHFALDVFVAVAHPIVVSVLVGDETIEGAIQFVEEDMTRTKQEKKQKRDVGVELYTFPNTFFIYSVKRDFGSILCLFWTIVFYISIRESVANVVGKRRRRRWCDTHSNIFLCACVCVFFLLQFHRWYSCRTN